MTRVAVWRNRGCPLWAREIALTRCLDRGGAIAFVDAASASAFCPRLAARFEP